MKTGEVEELTEEQKAHIAVLRRKFFRGVSVFSVFGTIILLIILRFTVYNHKTVADYEQYFDHKDKFMRFNAAKALGSFKNDPKATRLLVRMLNDESREVRWHAAASLSKLKDPVSVPNLLQVLEREKDVAARSITIYALGQIKDQRSVVPLQKLFEKSFSDKSLEAKEAGILQLSLIQALASFDQPETRKILQDFEKSPRANSELKAFSIKMRASKGQAE